MRTRPSYGVPKQPMGNKCTVLTVLNEQYINNKNGETTTHQARWNCATFLSATRQKFPVPGSERTIDINEIARNVGVISFHDGDNHYNQVGVSKKDIEQMNEPDILFGSMNEPEILFGSFETPMKWRRRRPATSNRRESGRLVLWHG